MENFYDICNQYQIRYDCAYDRQFDNSKIDRVTNNKIRYTHFSDGCSKCLTLFLRKPVWRNVNWKLNFWMDRTINEQVRIWNVIGTKEKLRYLKYIVKH